MTHQVAPYGPVHGPPTGEITRRSFMRRMLGVGVGILSLEFLGGTLAFLWPNLSEGLGANINIGSASDINAQFPDWATGLPYIYSSANLFIVNVPAAKARVEGNGTVLKSGDWTMILENFSPFSGTTEVTGGEGCDGAVASKPRLISSGM